MNDATELTLKLNIQKINLILSALGQLPYAQVVTLINEIKASAEEQLQKIAE